MQYLSKDIKEMHSVSLKYLNTNWNTDPSVAEAHLLIIAMASLLQSYYCLNVDVVHVATSAHLVAMRVPTEYSTIARYIVLAKNLIYMKLGSVECTALCNTLRIRWQEVLDLLEYVLRDEVSTTCDD